MNAPSQPLLRPRPRAIALPVSAGAGPRPGRPAGGAEAAPQAFEADRADILGMAGNYKVRFDMQRDDPWRADYTPIARQGLGRQRKSSA